MKSCRQKYLATPHGSVAAQPRPAAQQMEEAGLLAKLVRLQQTPRLKNLAALDERAAGRSATKPRSQKAGAEQRKPKDADPIVT